MEKELLESVLKKFWKDTRIAKVLNDDNESLTIKYQNFLSNINRVRVKAVLENGEESFRSVIVKVEHDPKTKFSVKYDIFKNETMIYDKVLKAMGYLIEEYKDEDGVLWCHLIHYLPYTTVVLEDLTVDGFKVLKKTSYYDLEHSLLAVRSLARYHAMSKVLEERGVISKENYSKWYVFDYTRVQQIWYWNMLKLVEGVKMFWSSYWSPIVDRFKITFDSLKEKLDKLGEVDETKFNTLNHGDCHKNNVLFKYSLDGKPNQLRFVDFQIPHYGSPCCDLMYMIYLGTEPSVRREHIGHLVKAYHQTLLKTLDKYEYSGKRPDLEEIEDGMEKLTFVGLFLLIFILPPTFVFEEMVVNFDLPKIYPSCGKEGYDMNLYKSEAFKRAVGPDIEKLTTFF